MIDFENYSTDPLVSTVVVTHPGDWHLLPRALRSLNGQLPRGEHEVIVMNDGPEDEAFFGMESDIQAIAKDWDFSLELVATKEHSGYYCVARNRSMELVRGHYIAHMDADNEFGEGHLRSLLFALRVPHPAAGWPHFAYTRRTYVHDEGAEDTGFSGPSTLRTWSQENVHALLQGPGNNFIDTGDLMVPKSVLFYVAELTGFVWNTNCRRYGDYDLVTRLAGCGLRGLAVDRATNIYHWTGKNLQLTRQLSDIMVIPADVYDKLKAEGKMR